MKKGILIVLVAAIFSGLMAQHPGHHGGFGAGPWDGSVRYHGTYAMSPTDFNAFVHDLRHIPFSSDRLEFAERVIRFNQFHTGQVKRMARTFSSDRRRLEVVKLAYHRTVDRERYVGVQEVFTFNSTIREFYRFLDRQAPPAACPTGYVEEVYPVMSAFEFDRARREIQRRNHADTRLRTALNVIKFNNLTSIQAKRLVELMSFREDKLRVAKAAFPKVVDPHNYFRVEQALPFDPDRRELRRFIDRLRR